MDNDMIKSMERRRAYFFREKIKSLSRKLKETGDKIYAWIAQKYGYDADLSMNDSGEVPRDPLSGEEIGEAVDTEDVTFED